MTKQEREIIYRAAEMVETGEERLSCVAIERAIYGHIDGINRWSSLTARYHEFYDAPPSETFWAGVDWDTKKGRDKRVLMLLMFAEAGK